MQHSCCRAWYNNFLISNFLGSVYKMSSSEDDNNVIAMIGAVIARRKRKKKSQTHPYLKDNVGIDSANVISRQPELQSEKDPYRLQESHVLQSQHKHLAAVMERIVPEKAVDSCVEIKEEIEIKEEPLEEESREFSTVDTDYSCGWKKEEPYSKNSSGRQDVEFIDDIGSAWGNGGHKYSEGLQLSSDEEMAAAKQRFTLEERIFIIENWFGTGKKSDEVKTKFEQAFPNTIPPSRQAMYELEKKFHETGSVMDATREGRPKTGRSCENVKKSANSSLKVQESHKGGHQVNSRFRDLLYKGL